MTLKRMLVAMVQVWGLKHAGEESVGCWSSSVHAELTPCAGSGEQQPKTFCHAHVQVISV